MNGNDGQGPPLNPAPLPTVQDQKVLALEERNRLLEASLPEHEKAIAVRVSSSAPTFEVKLPQERWIGIIMLPGVLYGLYYLIVLASVVAGEGLALGFTLLLAMFLAMLVGAVAVKKIALRPTLRLDEKGMHIGGKRMIFFEKTIPLDQLQGFSSTVKRRSLDNAESWHLIAKTSNGKEHLLGAVKDNASAQQIVTDLSQTLTAIRGHNTGYRVAI